MKKILVLFLSCLMVFSVTGCGKKLSQEGEVAQQAMLTAETDEEIITATEAWHNLTDEDKELISDEAMTALYEKRLDMIMNQLETIELEGHALAVRVSDGWQNLSNTNGTDVLGAAVGCISNYDEWKAKYETSNADSWNYCLASVKYFLWPDKYPYSLNTFIYAMSEKASDEEIQSIESFVETWNSVMADLQDSNGRLTLVKEFGDDYKDYNPEVVSALNDYIIEFNEYASCIASMSGSRGSYVSSINTYTEELAKLHDAITLCR